MELTERHDNKEGPNLKTNDSNNHNIPKTAEDKQPVSTAEKNQALQEDYDFVAHRQIQKPTNLLESTAHLIKGCLGGGILGAHEAFMKCGLWTSVVTTIFFGFYITYCVHILVKSAQDLCIKLRVPQMSYPDLAEKSIEVAPFPRLKKYGKIFRYIVDVTVCVDLFGSCCVYEIIIAKTIQELIEQTDKDGPISTLRLYILALLVPVLLLCMIRTLKYLAPLTVVADILIIMCVIATIVYATQAPRTERPAWKNFLGFFEFCGVVVFSMEGIGVSLPIENNMAQPKQFPIILCLGMTVYVTFMMMVGFFGYWGFGETLRTPVTLNFPKYIFPTVLKGLMALMIFITFGLCFWAAFTLVWHYLAKKHRKEHHYIWERVYRALFVVMVTVVAVVFPNMGNMMGLIGSFCLSNMGFIFPAIIETLVTWDSPGLGRYKWRLWKNILIFCVGIILFVSGTYSNGKALLGF